MTDDNQIYFHVYLNKKCFISIDHHFDNISILWLDELGLKGYIFDLSDAQDSFDCVFIESISYIKLLFMNFYY